MQKGKKGSYFTTDRYTNKKNKQIITKRRNLWLPLKHVTHLNRIECHIKRIPPFMKTITLNSPVRNIF